MDTALTSIGYRVHNLEELKEFTPAAFATGPDSKVTNQYSFISTEEIVKNIIDLGWDLHSTKQNGQSVHSRHHVRFVNPKMGYFNLGKDKVKPQIILDNSHNRTSSAQLHMGLFRLVCTNGLVVAMPGMYTGVKFRHMGVDKEELKQILDKAAEQYKVVGEHVNDMQDVKMVQDVKEEFAVQAIARREPHLFVKEDGTIDVSQVLKSTNPAEIISPIRGEDTPDNLWTVFNVVQERMIKGGYNRVSSNGRNSKTRGITNAVRNVEFNKELWGIAETFMS